MSGIQQYVEDYYTQKCVVSAKSFLTFLLKDSLLDLEKNSVDVFTLYLHVDKILIFKMNM